MDIINTYKKNGTGNKIKKTEPLCSPEFKMLDANSQREVIEERRQSLSKLTTESDVKIYRRNTKKHIQQMLNQKGVSHKSTRRSLSKDSSTASSYVSKASNGSSKDSSVKTQPINETPFFANSSQVQPTTMNPSTRPIKIPINNPVSRRDSAFKSKTRKVRSRVSRI